MKQYSTEDLARARPPILSLISKSEKARQKLGPEQWQHRMLTDNLKALYLALALMDGMGEGFAQGDREGALNALASMIARTQAAQPKFAAGTAQHTLLRNRVFALQLAENLISKA